MSNIYLTIYTSFFVIGVYAIYFSFVIITPVFYYYTLYKLAKQMKYDRPWLAFIPVLNSILIFQLADLNYILGLVFPLLFVVSVTSFIYVATAVSVNPVIAMLGFISMMACFLWFIASRIWPIYRIAKKNNKDPTMILFISLTPYTMLFTYWFLWPRHNLIERVIKAKNSKTNDTTYTSVNDKKKVIDKILS